MENRRDFIKKAALLTGALGIFRDLPASIKNAIAIEPELGSTFYDAEHVVLLMQENRSFDHSFGTLKGVRGFNDPRAIRLPNNNLVWLQSDRKGHTYAPFRLDIKNSNTAWTGNLPHSWENQSQARNQGRHDNWLEAKRSGSKSYADIPLTLGYYTREDIPFYYALADAFTICDQHFCSSITGTTTNRHFFWTGTCVPKPGKKPLVRNSDIYFNKWATWKTFPERLQEHGIDWKIYQNEVSIQTALDGSNESWLGNFTDNNLEWFQQYNITFKKSHLDFLKSRIAELPQEIHQLEIDIQSKREAETQKIQNNLRNKRQQLASYQKKLAEHGDLQYANLSDLEKELHRRAFQTNEADPNYHQVETVSLEDEGHTREIVVPKGDVLFEFRKDVSTGKLPTVSWLVAPQNFSDHPSAPMYGAWYVSEVLHILTQNPEVWKKTIFILNYDENDGYYDHIPPFVAPDPADPTSGRCTPDLDYSDEYVSKAQELEDGQSESAATAGPVGLGYRVPLIIASPWSRGGWVNSEVFDITSTIQFLEKFVNRKFGIELYEENISSWRRAITGDLTSSFRPQTQLEVTAPAFLDRNQQILTINKSRSMNAPNTHHLFTADEIAQANQAPQTSPYLPRQEPGVKSANPLNYELYADDQVDTNSIKLSLSAANSFFGTSALGAPFNIHAGSGYRGKIPFWAFAASAGNTVRFSWDIQDFTDNIYDLVAYGPNGWMRSFKGSHKDPAVKIACRYEKNRKNNLTGNIELQISNTQDTGTLTIRISATIYQKLDKKIKLKPGQQTTFIIDGGSAHHWYECAVQIEEYPHYLRTFAGKVETGIPSTTDPQMGRVI